MPDPAFADLIDRVRRRDPQAAVDFVRRHRPPLEREVRRRLTRWQLTHRIDPEDVCQAVLVDVFGWLSRETAPIDDPDWVAKWMSKSARNRIVDEVRKCFAARRGAGDHPSTNADDWLAAAPADVGTPSGHVSGDETIAAIYRGLTPDERDLADRRARGDDWAAIAAAVGGSPDAVRKKFHRALDRVLSAINPPD